MQVRDAACCADPQVHTIDGNGFGQGNCGKQGIHKFLGTHRCNEICTYLGLKPIRMEHETLTLVWPIGFQEGQEITFEGPDDRPQKLRLPQQDLMLARGPGLPFQATVQVICSADRAGGGQVAAVQQAVVVNGSQQQLMPNVIDAQGRFDRSVYAMVAVPKHPTCPPGLGPGQRFKYSTPDGGCHWCVVPPGCKPGERFGVVLPIAVPKEYIRLHARSKAEVVFVAKRYWKLEQRCELCHDCRTMCGRLSYPCADHMRHLQSACSRGLRCICWCSTSKSTTWQRCFARHWRRSCRNGNNGSATRMGATRDCRWKIVLREPHNSDYTMGTTSVGQKHTAGALCFATIYV